MSMGSERDITPDFLGAKILLKNKISIPTYMLSKENES